MASVMAGESGRSVCSFQLPVMISCTYNPTDLFFLTRTSPNVLESSQEKLQSEILQVAALCVSLLAAGRLLFLPDYLFSTDGGNKEDVWGKKKTWRMVGGERSSEGERKP